MSINVTVSGNPVYIKKGNMVTACDPAKSEFEKRRLMRLEQVRQQSKDIAETIRNKLKKDKAKCMSEIEKEGEIKLKNWQAKKLLELQNQYQEALEEIGIGHKDAEHVEDEEEILLEQRESNDKFARERGRAAAERLQIEKNEESLRKAVPIQRRKITRDGENSRSNAVASLHKVKQGKSPFKKKKKRPQQTFDSDGENKVPQLFDLGEMASISSVSLEATNVREPHSPQKISKEQQTSQSQFQVPKSDKAAQTSTHEEILASGTREAPFDTRISEHIKRRARLNQHLDYCDVADKELPLRNLNKAPCTCCQCPGREETVTKPTETQVDPEHGFPPYQQSRQPVVEDKFLYQQPPVSRSQPPIKPSELHQQRIDEEDRHLYQQPSMDRPQLPSKPLEPSQPRIDAEDRVPYQQPSVDQSQLPLKDSDESSKPTLSKSQKQKDEVKTTKVKNRKDEIPSKPKITLKSSKSNITTAATEPASKPAHYYDHANRYSKKYIPKHSGIEKIDDENLEISPNLVSDDDFRDKMHQRDIDAQVRGQVALEKERIQREYKELLKKLPVLQKQERIYDIGADKEKYHMSRDRLEEMEKKRQNRLDNAYEELFVRWKPALVTLSKRKTTEEVPSLNLGSWDVDFEPTNESSNNRTEQLNNLLMNLKAQKDSLIKEIENTLTKDTLNEEVLLKSTDYQKPQRKRSREERPVSPTSSDAVLDESESKSKMSSKKEVSTAHPTTSPSPRKKAKLKSRKKVMVLQNMSTQTTPKTGQSAATSPVTTVTTLDTDVCVCPKNLIDDMCEIVIRIKEDEQPEVTVNPPLLGKKVKVIKEEKKTEVAIPEEVSKNDKSKDSSVFSKESERSKKSSTSTKKSSKTTSWQESLSRTVSSQSTTSTSYMELPKSGRSVKTTRKSSEFEEIWKNSTFSDGSRRLDPRLLTYIKKLLKMSRASIDDLAVSATSDVSTPGDSVMETPSNNPILQLRNVMKYFNLDYAELQRQLSYYSDENSLHYNTVDSVTVSSTSSDGGKSVQFKSCTEFDSSEKKAEETTDKLMQYAEIAASCTKKISNLTAMIEKVREEKKKILQSPPTSSSTSSDKDITTTSYLNLPDKKEDEDKDSSISSRSSQEDVGRKLLTIDYSYAEKLKTLTDAEIEQERRRIESTDEDLLSKLKNMLQDSADTATITERTEVTLTKHEEKKEEPPPLFLDIPKLPRLEAPSLDEEEKKQRKPPPSKGLRILGGPVPLVPHELSTIIEADSQISTKMESPEKKTPPKTSSGSSSVPDILTEVPQHKEVKSYSNNSSDEVSEMETMETMLISIGMEWAIPTLKKTREALALSSSSGSGESKKESGELSLREFLNKISSTSSSNGSVLSDSQGISLIQVDNRRTSTPILEQSKKEGQPAFLTDSDISSVREQSNDGSKTG